MLTVKNLTDYFNHEISKTRVSDEKTAIFKIKQFNKFVNNLKKLDENLVIESAEKLKDHISGIGPGISRRIESLIDNPELLNEIESMDKLKSKGPNKFDLTTIHGVGPAKAKQWKKLGINSIDEVRERQEELKLTHAISIGLKYWEDLQERIPREEIVEFHRNISETIFKDYIWNICGSFRRGNSSSGDIDILISSNPGNIKTLTPIIKQLKENGFLEADITPKCTKKYMGVGKLLNHHDKAKYRRIDIRLIPEDEYGAALLYFTGSKEFNIRCRDIAREKEWKLNEYGLWDSDNNRIPNSSSELQILNLLGLKWISPEMRT